MNGGPRCVEKIGFREDLDWRFACHFGERGDTMSANRLTRSRSHRVIAGVCGGIAEHYGWSLGLVRFLFVLFGLFGAGEVAYIVLWIVMPKQ